METEPLFSGNALGAVDAEGRVRLPPFVLNALACRHDGRRLVFGAHDSDPCLTGYGPSHRTALLREVERRRLRDEAAGEPVDHGRVRRAFGFAEEAEYDARGRIALPALMRRRGRIGGLALFVGTGASFEIWNPQLALEAGDPELRDMAAYRLNGTDGDDVEEERTI